MEVARNDVARNTQPRPTSGQAEAQQAPREEARPARVRALSPPVDIFENQDAITIHVDVPGVQKEDLTLRLEKNELSIVASRRDALQGPIEYRRTFSLPQEIDGEAIVADLSRGVLSLQLPRKASAKPRTIQIR